MITKEELKNCIKEEAAESLQEALKIYFEEIPIL